MAMNWYAVQTFSGFENRAKAALEDAIRRGGLDAQFGEILVPTETVVEIRNGQKKSQTRKVYPGYMFVQMEMNRQTFHLVQTTPKVAGFTGSATSPPALPEHEVRGLLNQADEEDESKPKPIVHFERGEEVRIIDGSFASMNARVEEVNQARGKLKVVVTFFGRPTPVELDFTQVERL
jgi:transcriptional antiterminator NusG